MSLTLTQKFANAGPANSSFNGRVAAALYEWGVAYLLASDGSSPQLDRCAKQAVRGSAHVTSTVARDLMGYVSTPEAVVVDDAAGDAALRTLIGNALPVMMAKEILVLTDPDATQAP